MVNPISKLGLGTVQFGIKYGISNIYGKTSEKEVYDIINFAENKGIDLLDTASVYGSSEIVIGHNDLRNFKVVSKFMNQSNKQKISSKLEKSLKELGIDKLYGYLAHRPMEIVNNIKLWKALTQLRDVGYIKKIGFSFNEVNEIDAVIKKNYYPDLIQVPFNFLDHRFEDYMIYFHERGCEIHARSPFLQGLFFTDIDQLNDFFNDVKPVLCKLKRNGSKLPGMLLRYCIEKPFIDRVIFGVNTLIQLKENLISIFNSDTLVPISLNIKEELLVPSKWII